MDEIEKYIPMQARINRAHDAISNGGSTSGLAPVSAYIDELDAYVRELAAVTKTPICMVSEKDALEFGIATVPRA